MQGDTRKWLIELDLKGDLLDRALPLYSHMSAVMPALFQAWLEVAEEEELKELAYFLSISKRAEKKKIALDFFRSYFSKLRQTDKREKIQGFVQAEDKKLTSEEFIRKYGSILKL